MPAANDLEKRAMLILDNAYWLQGIVCQGCTNLLYTQAEKIDGKWVFLDPHCLNVDCPGHDPVMAYPKALQVVAGVYGKEASDVST